MGSGMGITAARLSRPEIDAATLGVIVAVYLLVTANLSFWDRAWQGFETGTALAAFAIATLAVFLAVTLGLAFRFVAKPLYVFALLAAAGASYFTDTFGTIINANMMENVIATTSVESDEFLTAAFLIHLAVYGVLPALVVLWLRLRHPPFGRALRRNLALSALSVAVAGLMIWPNVGEVRAAMRRDFHAMMETLNPPGPVSAALKVAIAEIGRLNRVREPYGLDARKGDWIRRAGKPVVAVIVAGESARAMNFSLNGYGRDTNPELARRDVLSFRDVTACGTETNISLRCMFSGLRQTEFSRDRADGRESLLDVFRHAGFDVIWWDNDAGSKGVADGVTYVSYMMRNHPDLCLAGTCQDDIFLEDLGHLLRTVTKDTVIVLHQRGSHGPAYYLRYPDTFGPFRPDCRAYAPTDCAAADLLNAYDNTIAYTDRFLARAIDLVEKHADRLTGLMFYVSDHGESLGEGGRYMHGIPFAIAPPEQTKVPLILWTSSGYDALSGFRRDCARGLVDRPYSHDNVYHTLLGLLDVESSIYDPGRDMFVDCRGAGTRMNDSAAG
jgi:lipid A ethanolaminephosphotransferase